MNITAIDLNLLHVLHAVLVEHSVTRAAARLHVTPSAVSNSLARLRELLGDPLVTRKGRGIVPTPRAGELAPVLARALGDLESALGTPAFDAATCTRTFTVAVADVGQVAWMPRLAAALGRAMPRAQLRVVGIDALVSLGDLGASEIDLHIGVPGTDPGLRATPLLHDRSVLVVRRGHPAVRGGKLSRAALASVRHVRVELVPGSRFPDPIAKLFARARIAREVAVTVPAFGTAAAIVATTELATMLPASLLAVVAARLRLDAPATPLPVRATAIAMSWHERTHADPAARAFRDLVRRVVAT